MSQPLPHLHVGEYKGKPQVSFHSTKDHDDVISFREQAVSMGAAKVNLILLAVAVNGPAAVLTALLDVASAYEPSDRQAKANPPLTAKQRKAIEAAITALSPPAAKGDKQAA